MLPSTSRQSSCRRTAWWKSGDDEDTANRNDPATPNTSKMALANRQLNSRVIRSVGHVVDNFRFVTADRKWTENESRYVDENIKRCVRRYRRARSLDEESDKDNDEVDGDLHFLNNLRNYSASVNFYRCSEDTARTSDAYSDVEQRTSLTTMKRLRSQWTSDPLFSGRSVDEQRAINDLLSLDKDDDEAMEVDSEHEERQTVHDNCRTEFRELSNELHCLSLSHVDPKITADSTSTACPQLRSEPSGPPPRSPVVFLTSEKQTGDGKYSAGRNEVAVQLLSDNDRPGSPDNTGHAMSTGSNLRAFGGTAGNDPDNSCWNSVSVSHPKSIFRHGVDYRRSKLDDDRSELELTSCVKSLSPLLLVNNEPTTETAANSRGFKSLLTPTAVSLIYYKCNK